MVQRVRKMFPGGNTSRGFYSYYRYVPPENVNRVFILKGGPGAGKSDFMKKIARDMMERGFSIELHYCSSDNDSLDALLIESLKVVLLDGTAPHMIDPKYPGAVDEIVNLGEFWDAKALVSRKGNIIKYSKRKGEHFARAYKMLAASKLVIDDVEAKYGSCMDYGRANLAAAEWSDEMFKGRPISSIPGNKRHLFAGAYTPGGFVDYSHTLVEENQRLYCVRGYPGTGKTYFLDKLASKAIERGIKVEYFHSPLKPEKIHTIVLCGCNIIVTCNENTANNAYKGIDLNSFLDKEKLRYNREHIKKDMELYRQLISEAVSAVSEAKGAHDLLEEYYINSMDFTAVDGLRDSIIKRILEYH